MQQAERDWLGGAQAAQHAKELEGEGGSLQSQIHDLEARNRRLKEELARTRHERDRLQERSNDVNKVRRTQAAGAARWLCGALLEFACMQSCECLGPALSL